MGVVAAREAAQALVIVELGRMKSLGQLGHEKKRLQGLGWKRKMERALKRKRRRKRLVDVDTRRQVEERRLHGCGGVGSSYHSRNALHYE